MIVCDSVLVCGCVIVSGDVLVCVGDGVLGDDDGMHVMVMCVCAW